ncbi:hypothetical protein D9M70_653380 [compost metagenome]
MIRARQQRHVGILARNVLHRRVGCLAQSQRIAGVGDNAPTEGDDDTRRISLDCDRMIGAGNLDRFV